MGGEAGNLRKPRSVGPPSSSGQGRRPFKAVTRVRIPLGVPRRCDNRCDGACSKTYDLLAQPVCLLAPAAGVSVQIEKEPERVGLCWCSTIRMMFRMMPVPVRFTPEEIKLLDELVAAGVGDTRSAVVRAAVVRLGDAVRRAELGMSIAASYREVPQSTEDDNLALANALAMTEAEPW